ncbi:hypothetical protein BDZ45DRAFT_439957 [Acephala macrosclerotiorum]|nr:hypothetical protein BDZ45DRAFT_439957 [Acephala macrosclerotiorum]
MRGSQNPMMIDKAPQQFWVCRDWCRRRNLKNCSRSSAASLLLASFSSFFGKVYIPSKWLLPGQKTSKWTAWGMTIMTLRVWSLCLEAFPGIEVGRSGYHSLDPIYLE